MAQARGLRNNNPLNIRRNDTRWQGLAAVQSDRDFFVFTAPCWGYRAAFVTLATYRHRYGLKRIDAIIARWAPANENDTAAYVAAVCRATGWQPSHEVDERSKREMCALVAAMSQVENGSKAVEEDVERGYELAS